MIQKVFVLPCSKEFDHDNNGNAVSDVGVGCHYKQTFQSVQ